MPALLGEPAGRPRPGVARLAAAVQEEDRAARPVPSRWRRDGCRPRREKSGSSVPSGPLGEEGRGRLACGPCLRRRGCGPGPGMSSALAFGMSAASSCAGAGDGIVASRPRRGSATAIEATSSSVKRLARAADAGGERLEVALRLLGEGAEHALHRIGQFVERGRLHGVRDARAAGRPRARGGCRARRGAASAPGTGR